MTVWAIMNANRQVFWNSFATGRTLLGRTAWFDKDHASACFQRFSLSEANKLSPGNIGDAPVHTAPVTALHVWNVQVFKNNDLVSAYQLAAQLVRKIGSALLDSVFDMENGPAKFSPFRAAFDCRVSTAAHLVQRLFVLFEKARVVYLFAIAQRGKNRQPDINSDHLRRFGQCVWLDNARETHIPAPKFVFRDRERFGLSLDRPVQSDTYIADFRQPKRLVVNQPEGLRLGVGETWGSQEFPLPWFSERRRGMLRPLAFGLLARLASMPEQATGCPFSIE